MAAEVIVCLVLLSMKAIRLFSVERMVLKAAFALSIPIKW